MPHSVYPVQTMCTPAVCRYCRAVFLGKKVRLCRRCSLAAGDLRLFLTRFLTSDTVVGSRSVEKQENEEELA